MANESYDCIKICLWCGAMSLDVPFNKKAHTIPKSLGGQNYNKFVCDSCNNYFGDRASNNNKYSIEEALKETFIITRTRLLIPGKAKRKVGRFKSKFFDVKEKNGRYSLSIKPSFRFVPGFQNELCHSFKRGLYKMFFEEFNLQKGFGMEGKYDIIRAFARFNKIDLPVFYFRRKIGILALFEREAETPILLFDRMKYLFSNDKFIEIEFLGHVFGFPISDFNTVDLQNYLVESYKLKTTFFLTAIELKRITDIDFTLSIMNN